MQIFFTLVLLLVDFGNQQMLAKLGLTQLILLTDSPLTTYVGLDAYGLEITGTRPIMGDS